jgi:hypothetical protein
VVRKAYWRIVEMKRPISWELRFRIADRETASKLGTRCQIWLSSAALRWTTSSFAQYRINEACLWWLEMAPRVRFMLRFWGAGSRLELSETV